MVKNNSRLIVFHSRIRFFRVGQLLHLKDSLEKYFDPLKSHVVISCKVFLLLRLFSQALYNFNDESFYCLCILTEHMRSFLNAWLTIRFLCSFRKEHICSYRESKKSFEKASERYYKQLESTLGLSHKKKEQQLQVGEITGF